MKTEEVIRRHLSQGEFEFSEHGFDRAIERNISDAEICEAGANARIIEDYPDDKYGSSCLVLGFTQSNRPLHIQVTTGDAAELKIITVYEPDRAKWVDFAQRRK